MALVNFDEVLKAVKSRSFKDEKLQALESSLSSCYGYLSAGQVAELVKEFPFDDDKVKAVTICAPRMASATCEEAAHILRVFSFGDGKIQALELIVGHITNNNVTALNSVLSFSSEKERAREIIENRRFVGVPSGTAPPMGYFSGMQAPGGQYPGPGQPQYPGQGVFPGGPYAPGQQYYPPPGQVPSYYPSGVAPPPGSYPYNAGPAVGGMMGSGTGAFAPPYGHGVQPTSFGGYPHPGYHYPPPR